MKLNYKQIVEEKNKTKQNTPQKKRKTKREEKTDIICYAV